MRKPIDVVVLDTVQAAAADLTLAGGVLSVLGLSETVKLSDGIASSFASFAAGTVSVKDYDYAAVTLLANSTYRFAVVVDGHIAFHGGGKEANQLVTVRQYVVSTGAVAPTAAALRTLMQDRINLDPDALVTASAGAGAKLRLTLDSVTEGDFGHEATAGVVETIVTPFVASAGTPAIVTDNGGTPAPAGAYDTYTLTFNKERRSNVVNGGTVLFPEDVKVYFESTSGNAAAFIVEMDLIIAGTHTPVADYLGMP